MNDNERKHDKKRVGSEWSVMRRGASEAVRSLIEN